MMTDKHDMVAGTPETRRGLLYFEIIFLVMALVKLLKQTDDAVDDAGDDSKQHVITVKM